MTGYVPQKPSQFQHLISTVWQHSHWYPVHHNLLCKTLFAASKVVLRKTAAFIFHTSSHKHLSRCQQRATLLGCQYLICSKIKSRVIRPSSSSQEFSADMLSWMSGGFWAKHMESSATFDHGNLTQYLYMHPTDAQPTAPLCVFRNRLHQHHHSWGITTLQQQTGSLDPFTYCRVQHRKKGCP